MMQFSVFAEIDGVGAASGLYFKDGIIYLIGDSSAYLYQYYVEEKQLERTQILFSLIGDESENIIKANKPDFESICFYDHHLFVIGSGSTENRNKMLTYSLKSEEIIEKDLSLLFDQLRRISSIDTDNFNIEGAVFTGTEWLLFNRGNGALCKNGVFRIAALDFDLNAAMSFVPIDLPMINNVKSSFTDAVIVGSQVYFLTTAEDTTSTYEDGEVVGSMIGSMDIETLEINFIEKISDTHKFEGLAVYNQTSTEIEFLLCEDQDNEELTSVVYRLTMDSIL